MLLNRATLVVGLALALCASARASEQAPGVPGAGEGTATLLAGARIVPQGGFIDDQKSAGYRPWKTFVEPGFLLALGYAPDLDFQATIDLGYGLNTIHMSPGDLSIRSFTILLGADASFVRRSWGTLYAGGGIGYSLNTLGQNGNTVEANSTAGYICLGARFPLLRTLALVIEERYTLAYASLPSPGTSLNFAGSSSSINVGGNLLSIGLQFHYTDPEDAKRPHHQ